jgi:hypothetical protein
MLFRDDICLGDFVANAFSRDDEREYLDPVQ